MSTSSVIVLLVLSLIGLSGIIQFAFFTIDSLRN